MHVDTWEDCGNAVYEDYQYPIEKVRKHFHCQQLHFPCKDCPVYREKRTREEKNRDKRSGGKGGRSRRL